MKRPITKVLHSVRQYLRQRHGMTMVEVLIALVILLMVALALMRTAIVSIEANTRNMLRDEAGAVAEEILDRMRSVQFEQVMPNANPLDFTYLNCDDPPNDQNPKGTQIVDNWGANTTDKTYTIARKVRDLQQIAPDGKKCEGAAYRVRITGRSLSAQQKQITVRVEWAWKGDTWTTTPLSMSVSSIRSGE